MSATNQTPISNRGLPAQFLCTPPYYNPLHLAGVTASIDNARVKFTYSKSMFDFNTSSRINVIDTLLRALDTTSLYMEGLFDIQHSESNFRIGNYAHTFTYKITEGQSFAVMVGRFNFSGVNQIAAEAIMDFNPNKIPSRAWHRIAGILAANAIATSVQRFDLALDFMIPRDQLRLVHRPGSNYHLLSDDKYTKTEYTGERSHHAAVKLYDKGAELHLPLPLTRLEITIEARRFKSLRQLLPDIIDLAPLDIALALDDLPFEVQAVILHPDLYERMKKTVSRNTWGKYKRLLEQYQTEGGSFYFALPEDQIVRIEDYTRTYIAALPRAHLSPEVIT
ncbi:MAG: hypothetical protein IJW94_00455 [Oscillospiraceae bacterium]|nr:hypothetical protein [Oscillospiraceae bacterium]